MPKNQIKIYKNKCCVCGDNALGRNFGVITCESCKGFFRRNIFKAKNIYCNLNEKCVINVENRRLCSKCRLNKCLDIGMRKELIMINNARERSNSFKSDRIGVHSIWGSIDSNNCSSIDSRLSDPEFDSLFENCCLSEQQINEEMMKIEESLNNSINSSDLERVHKICELSVVSVIRPIATFNKVLNDIELSRLQELSSAVHCLELLGTPLTANIIEFSTLEEYYSNSLAQKRCDEFARHYIKYCKKLESFKEICSEDQISLIKRGFYESAQWLALPLFNIYEEHITYSLDNEYSLRFPLHLYKKAKQNIYEMTKKFYQRIREEWILDSTIRNLLSMISLFDPKRPKLVYKELIKLKQQMYLYLLQRYLIQKYGSESESMEMCSNMISCVQELQKVTALQIELEKVYMRFTTPLLKEFLV